MHSNPLFGSLALCLAVRLLAACSASEEQQGPPGEMGPPGPQGPPGAEGSGGPAGPDGTSSGQSNGSSSGEVSSSGGTAQEPPVDGSRIKHRWSTQTSVTTASDGAQSSMSYRISSLYDTLRQEECTFVRAADGATRCLPTGLAKLGTLSMLYVDAQCAHPVVAVYRDATSLCGGPQPQPPKYITYSIPSTDPCAPGGLSVMPAGSKLPGGMPMWGKSGTTCYVYPGAADSYDVYERQPEIAPSSFVSSTTTVTTVPDP